MISAIVIVHYELKTLGKTYGVCVTKLDTDGDWKCGVRDVDGCNFQGCSDMFSFSARSLQIESVGKEMWCL